MIDTQRNLLIGVLALQCHLVTSEGLVAALEKWIQDKRRALDLILLEQGALDDKSHKTLLALVDRHLAQHGNVIDQSLAVFSIVPALKIELLRIEDNDLRKAVSQLSLGDDSSAHAVATLDATVPATQQRTSEETPNTNAMHHAETMLFSADAQTVSTGKSIPAKTLRYRTLRPHAKGGLGEVFLAQDQELNREVALKEIQLRHAGRKDSRARFLLCLLYTSPSPRD